MMSSDEAIAYVDGSYDVSTGKFACGIVLWIGENKEEISHAYDHSEMSEMRNVAGEIMGSSEAIKYCLEHNVGKLTIYHDYEGIAKWCTGEWKAKKQYTKAYAAYYAKARAKMQIDFVKVKGHSGDRYNDEADRLARSALSLD